jgi:phosphohistidine phosphatase SixA
MTVKKALERVQLGAIPVCTLEPVATHLKMPWKYHLPTLALNSDTAQAALHLVGEAAPFLLQRTAGYALMSFARMASQVYHLAYRQTRRLEKVKIGLDLVSTLSPLLMTISRIAPGYFIAAQAAKIGIELKETMGELRNWRQLSKEEICDKLLPVISHAFYLISLWRGSAFKIRAASLLFQGAVSYYQTYKEAKKGNKLAGFIWGAIGTLRCFQGCQYIQFKTAEKPRFVYKQRHAEKQKDSKNAALTERGHEQSRLAGPLVEKYLEEKTGVKNWTYACSAYLRSRQTALGMLQGVGRPGQTLFIDGRLGEKISGESKRYLFERHFAAVDDLNDEIADPNQGLVTIDHSIAGKAYARGRDYIKPPMTRKDLHYVEGYLFKDGKLEDRFRPQRLQADGGGFV